MDVSSFFFFMQLKLIKMTPKRVGKFNKNWLIINKFKNCLEQTESETDIGCKV